MKKALIFLFVFSFSAIAQISLPAPSPVASVSQRIGLQTVQVVYSRPSIRGRKMFGNIVPFGALWRTGANQISNISFEDEIFLNGTAIPAGTYGLLTIPGEQKWQIIISKDTDLWGAYAYNPANDVLRLSADPIANAFVETFTISFENTNTTHADIQLAWENTKVMFHLEHDIEKRILAEIAAKTSDINATIDTYFDAADFYYEKNINLEQALQWATVVINREPEYWTYQLRARIAHKMGDCKQALIDARKSYDLSKKAGDTAYMKKNESIFAECK